MKWLWCLQGRFTIAAKHHMTIAEIYETDMVDVEKVTVTGPDIFAAINFCKFDFKINFSLQDGSFTVVMVEVCALTTVQNAFKLKFYAILLINMTLHRLAALSLSQKHQLGPAEFDTQISKFCAMILLILHELCMLFLSLK